MRILLDTNVILDVAQKREPFYSDAARILQQSDFERTHLHITGSTATDIYYLLRKAIGHEQAMAFIAELLNIVDVCGVDKIVLLKALMSELPDFEDAVQNAAAIQSQMDVIVTRDKSHFQASPLTVLNPAEFIAAHLP
jgi:predicted nucleic acid-binding protein